MNSKVRNIIKMIEKGIESDDLTDRLTELNEEKRDLEQRIATLENSSETVSKEQVKRWLKRFIHGDIEDTYFRMKLVEYLVSSIVVWDDGEDLVIETILNTTGRPLRCSVDKDKVRRKIEDDEPLYAEGLFAMRNSHRMYAGRNSRRVG